MYICNSIKRTRSSTSQQDQDQPDQPGRKKKKGLVSNGRNNSQAKRNDMMEQSPTQNSPDSDMFIEEMKCEYTWNIDNFNSCVKTYGECKISPYFPVPMNDDLKWSLQIYPKGCDNHSGDYVAFFLRLDSCKKTEVIASYVISIYDSEFEIQRPIKTVKPMKFSQGTVHGYTNFITRDEIDRLLFINKLTILCEISVKVNINGHDNIQVKVPRGCVLGDITKLHDDNMILSDVMLVAGGKEIRAHKLILAARSPVFAAMFQHDMQEQNLSRVDITDLDPEVLTEMVRFIYTDRTSNLDKIAPDLLVAADKYKLDNLKVLCEEALCRNLSVETAAETLVLADIHSVNWLKKQTIAFINSRHVGKVMATEGWKKMTSTHLHLVAELFGELTVEVQQYLPIYKK